jgi:hypothetical protein
MEENGNRDGRGIETDGVSPYPWDDWATERRARLLLDAALASCRPDGGGEFVADPEALARLESRHNGHLCRLVMRMAEERAVASDCAAVVIVSQYGCDRAVASFCARLGGWRAGPGGAAGADAVLRVLLAALEKPKAALSRIRYERACAAVPTTDILADRLPPGPHRCRGWFDTVVSALAFPRVVEGEEGHRPLDPTLCTAGTTLARALLTLGSRRIVVACSPLAGSGTVDWIPPEALRAWEPSRARLESFIALMQRVHATWSLYLPLVAPTEHAINRSLVPSLID